MIRVQGLDCQCGSLCGVHALRVCEPLPVEHWRLISTWPWSVLRAVITNMQCHGDSRQDPSAQQKSRWGFYRIASQRRHMQFSGHLLAGPEQQLSGKQYSLTPVLYLHASSFLPILCQLPRLQIWLCSLRLIFSLPKHPHVSDTALPRVRADQLRRALPQARPNDAGGRACPKLPCSCSAVMHLPPGTCWAVCDSLVLPQHVSMGSQVHSLRLPGS